MKNVDPRYVDGTYEADNPDWHEEDAEWKASLVRSMERRNGLSPETLCDVGCGTGGVLRALQGEGGAARATGFDVSASAIEKARDLSPPTIEFELWTGERPSRSFDLALLLDVFEHVPDYLGFLQDLKGLASRYIFHIPLDMNAQGVARMSPILWARESVGHLHYFSRETAIASLEYAGFEVTDWMFTPSWERLEDASKGKRAFGRLRSNAFRRWPEQTVRILGGYSVMVLATESAGDDRRFPEG